MPATPDTIGSIGRKRLGLMKQTAFLINVARAEIIDEDALYEALARRSIAGGCARCLVSLPARGGLHRAGDAQRPGQLSATLPQQQCAKNGDRRVPEKPFSRT